MSELGPRPFRIKVLWLLLAAAFVMALPALNGDILGYDDRNLLLGEEGAFARSPFSFFTSLYYYAYLPFYGLSYWIDGKLGGGSPALIHLGNVFWHAATSYLVFCLLALLLNSRVGALFGALIFAVHPAHVESVAWISGRKEVLGGFLLFLAWLLHLRERRGWAVAVFLAACFTKATAVVLPGLLLAAAALLPRYAGKRRQAAAATWPFLLAAALPVAVHLLVGAESGVVREVGDLGARLASGLSGWGGSLRHALVPLGLSIDYPEARGVSAINLVVLAAGIAAAAWAWRRGAGVAAFGLTAFFVALLPHNNVFPATDVFMADRYLYVAIFGVSALVAWAVELRRDAPVLGGLLATVLVFVALLSSRRFTSDEALWTATIRARDPSALAWFQRGTARIERAQAATPQDDELMDRGITDLQAALSRAALTEHKVKANAALVLPLVLRGRPAEALERASTARELLGDPQTAEARRFSAQLLYHRGVARKARGEWSAAAADFHASAVQWERYRARYEEGYAWFRAGRPQPARLALKRAADLDRRAVAPLIVRANVERMVQDMAAYKRALSDAAARDPGSGEVAEGWVKFWLYGPKPDFFKARKALERLPEVSRRRRLVEGQVEAAHALFRFRAGELEEAVRLADRARKLGLGSVPENYDLGQIYLEAGRYDDAIRCFQESVDLLERRGVHKVAVARGYALKANALIRAGLAEPAKAAMRRALEAGAEVIEAGAAPLRGEIERLKRVQDADLLLLAAACVAGDPATGRPRAETLLNERELGPDDRTMAIWLRGLLRTFALYDFEGAESDFRAVLEREPESRWARYRQAQVAIKAGATWLRTAEQLKSVERREQGRSQIEAAIAGLTELVKQHPDFYFARLLRGQAYFGLDRLTDAKADYVFVREHKAIKEVYVQEAALHRLSYVQGGQVETLMNAEKLLRQALVLDPNYFEALFELGNVYHLLYDKPGGGPIGRKEAFLGAALWYRRAMALNRHALGPQVEWAALLLKGGQEAIAAGRIERADQLIARLEAQVPEIPEVHRQRVLVNLMPEFDRRTKTKPDAVYAAVEKALRKLAQLQPGHPDLNRLRSAYHRSRGESYFLTYGRYLTAAKKAAEAGDQERAERLAATRDRARELTVEQWKQALGAWLEDPDNLGIRDRLRSLDPAFVELDRQRAKRAFDRGQAAWNAGRFREAASAFGVAARTFPAQLELRFWYARALARAGLLDKARPELEWVANHERGAEFPDAFLELGNLFSVKRNKPVAALWYQRYVEAMVAAGHGASPEVSKVRRILKELN